ncbi:MAG TPA: adenylate/guanylate cyclase domain-containing protein [Thermoanaerobaculia bacterium]|nr:adenylate/guanylate cyclase domain-containing protein [Thermoanaerobaculia bacterium]
MLLDERLRELITERLSDGADKAAIDRRIWQEYGEEWCVMATDLAGFSRNVAEFGIIHFLQTIFESERLLIPIIESHGGKLLKIEGDSFFVIFREPMDAIRASFEMQHAVRAYNENQPPEEKVLLGVGLGFGSMLRVGEEDVFGNEVNSACILGETYAGPYEILVTDAVRERAGRDAAEFEEFPYVPPGAGKAWRVIYSSNSDALKGD